MTRDHLDTSNSYEISFVQSGTNPFNTKHIEKAPVEVVEEPGPISKPTLPACCVPSQKVKRQH